MWITLVLACRSDSADPSPAPPTAEDTASGSGSLDLTAFTEDLRSEHDLPALSVAAFDADGLLAIGAAGSRKAEGVVGVTTADRWHLGSDTKAMTATLTAVAIEAGQLDWEDTVPDLFPDLTVDPAWGDVTVEDLLQHRSGMFGDANEQPAAWAGLWDDGAQADLRTAFVADVLARPPDYPIGEYLYSNFGYVTVGAALDRVAEPWEQGLAERIFAPLGMTSCGFGPPATPDTIDAPYGHYRTIDGFDPIDPADPLADNPPAFGPAGTVHCDLADWGAFGIEHLVGESGSGVLASAEAYSRLHTAPSGGDYAAGWGVGEASEFGGRYVAHDGSNSMFWATIVVALDSDSVYLATANLGDTTAAAATLEAVLGLPAHLER